MLIKICGNCKTYHYNNGPGYNGGCTNNNGETTSPLSDACEKFNPKKRGGAN